MSAGLLLFGFDQVVYNRLNRISPTLPGTQNIFVITIGDLCGDQCLPSAASITSNVSQRPAMIWLRYGSYVHLVSCRTDFLWLSRPASNIFCCLFMCWWVNPIHTAAITPTVEVHVSPPVWRGREWFRRQAAYNQWLMRRKVPHNFFNALFAIFSCLPCS